VVLTGFIGGCKEKVSARLAVAEEVVVAVVAYVAAAAQGLLTNPVVYRWTRVRIK